MDWREGWDMPSGSQALSFFIHLDTDPWETNDVCVTDNGDPIACHQEVNEEAGIEICKLCFL